MRIYRKQKIGTISVVACALSLCRILAAPASPNVVFIYADDLNPGGLRCYGGNVLTPEIDRLAEEGVRFTRYYATSAVCSPSRYSLLTGRYAGRCRALAENYPMAEPALVRWNTYLEGGEKTLAHLFNQAGYVTGLVGKHHNIENTQYQTHVDDDADPRDTSVLQILRQNYEMLQKNVRETTGFDEVINLYANNFFLLDIPAELQHHNLDWTAEGACRFIESHKAEPFFLHVALTVPHGGPEPLASLRADSAITPLGYSERDPGVLSSREEIMKRVSDAGLSLKTAESTWIDETVGAIMRKLRETGVAKRTIVFFASDHNEHGKMTCYDLGTRTPAILWGAPGVPPGQVKDELVANVDLVPTVLDACGVSIPENYRCDGKSWLPMLRGEVETVRNNLLLEITYTKAVVSKSWKYIATRFPSDIQKTITPESRGRINQEGNELTHDPFAGAVKARYGVAEQFPGYYDDDQLFCLDSDPQEQSNLAYRVEFQRELHVMQQTLRAFLVDANHAFGEFHVNQVTAPVRCFINTP